MQNFLEKRRKRTDPVVAPGRFQLFSCWEAMHVPLARVPLVPRPSHRGAPWSGVGEKGTAPPSQCVLRLVVAKPFFGDTAAAFLTSGCVLFSHVCRTQ